MYIRASYRRYVTHELRGLFCFVAFVVLLLTLAIWLFETVAVVALVLALVWLVFIGYNQLRLSLGITLVIFLAAALVFGWITVPESLFVLIRVLASCALFGAAVCFFAYCYDDICTFAHQLWFTKNS